MVTWWFYNTYIALIVLGLKVASLFNTKAKKAFQGRKDKLFITPTDQKRILIHCASLGEFEQAKPIIESLKSEYGYEILLTFFSPSGFENVTDYQFIDKKLYLPFDQNKKVKHFLEMIRPDAIIFVKYEFWWNFIRVAIDQKIPFFFISVAISKDHYLLKSWSSPFLKILKKVNHIFTIDQTTYKLFEDKGFKNITIAGDTRISSILNRKALAKPLQKIELFKSDKKLIVLGSTYHTEHLALINFLNQNTPGYKLVVFPHEIKEKDINKLKDTLPCPTAFYSDDVEKIKVAHVLIVDCIGILADTYQYADIAYIGGGFGRSIHNILEPFVYKLPLIFGPAFQKFPEAVYLAEFDFIKVIENAEEIFPTLENLLRGVDISKLEQAYIDIFEGAEIEKITAVISSSLNYIKE